MGCFTSFCAGDVSATSASQFQTQFCQASGSNPVTPAANNPSSGGTISTTGNNLPAGGGTIIVSAQSARATATGSVKANSAYAATANGIWSNTMVFGEFFIMLVLANIL